ncbi:hypothetical protein ACFQ46_10480 [Kineococcus sp. GCM10028916]|uniref:hypothetical protein n=1 Tax=Kineococcus sp. GCM10028916 TaxID=3273394 RepID=UPI00362A6DCB
MRAHRWPPAVEPDELGAGVHGPVVLARSPGIVAGLRCVFAYTDGVSLPFVLRAEGVQAEAANRQSFSGQTSLDEIGPGTSSWPSVAVQIGDHEGLVDASQAGGSSSDDVYDLDANFWIDALPADGRVVVTVSWVQAGLAESRTELRLRPWTGDDVLRLL